MKYILILLTTLTIASAHTDRLGYVDKRNPNSFTVNYLLLETHPNAKMCKVFRKRYDDHTGKANLLSRAIASSYAHKMRIFCEGCSKITIPK